MKKSLWLVLIVLLICVFSFSACDSEDTQQTPNGTPSGTTDNTTESETDAHVHAFGEWITVKDATCTIKGEQERSCSCGEKETQSIDATGHTEIIDAAVAATCTEPGLTEGKHCSVCSEILAAQEAVNITEHSYEEILPSTLCEGQVITYKCSHCDHSYTKQLETISADFDVCYWSYYDYSSEFRFVQDVIKFSNITGGHGKYTVIVTYTNIHGEVFTDTYSNVENLSDTLYLGNCSWSTTWLSPTSSAHIDIQDEIGFKTIYDVTFPGLQYYDYKDDVNLYSSDVVIDRKCEAIGHSIGEWIIDAEATCTADGSKHQACSRCNADITVTIPKLGHTSTTRTNCIEDENNGVFLALYRCNRCDTEYTEIFDPITASCEWSGTYFNDAPTVNWKLKVNGGMGNYSYNIVLSEEFSPGTFTVITGWSQTSTDIKYMVDTEAINRFNRIALTVWISDDVGSVAYTFYFNNYCSTGCTSTIYLPYKLN